MKIKDILNALERFAPLPLQDGFDNSGLQIGLTEVEATGALLCLDVTEEIIDEAIQKGCNLIIAHHPLLFKGCKSITGKDYVERCVMKAIKNDIAIYAAHTNLDNATGGVNFKIAEKLGLINPQILSPKSDLLYKLVTFVPLAQAEEVRQTLFQAGCGHIGEYDSCSYNIQGEGTFRALDGAQPFCGEVGTLHTEPEVRIETIFPSFKKSAVVRALVQAHPYEEPAFDIYPLANSWSQVGAGVIASLPEPIDEKEFLLKVKNIFQVGSVKHSKLRGKPIQKVALCGGSGAFLLHQAIGAGADIFISAEIKYHDYFGNDDLILMADIGHYESEQYTKELFYSIIKDKFPTFALHFTEVNTNPIKYL
ncbi:Nif3-like dinuclear metal center hexameric protein [Bacteroides coprosuis]|uniref:Nif3-like dinuclear metal center hexameric protein n=1 Tax=Bacteroides coprosuis TaxID=151276 RepID=UPI001E01CAB9|nr:Nif3-like dinuclear metal center hexameric protein [Bacteroides coprosuis]HJD91261.1 Nif3-like dinuclear metal center hexameric protein [Bacteroides coprosuis]